MRFRPGLNFRSIVFAALGGLVTVMILAYVIQVSYGD